MQGRLCQLWRVVKPRKWRYAVVLHCVDQDMLDAVNFLKCLHTVCIHVCIAFCLTFVKCTLIDAGTEKYIPVWKKYSSYIWHTQCTSLTTVCCYMNHKVLDIFIIAFCLTFVKCTLIDAGTEKYILVWKKYSSYIWHTQCTSITTVCCYMNHRVHFYNKHLPQVAFLHSLDQMLKILSNMTGSPQNCMLAFNQCFRKESIMLLRHLAALAKDMCMTTWRHHITWRILM